MAQPVLASPVRSPMADQHIVKPWSDGKLCSPPVAALAYRRNRHVINVSVWPAPQPSPPLTRTLQGYHEHGWTAAGMQFWAAADLDDQGLSEFLLALQARL